MLGPYTFARYIAGRWRMSMVPFYGGVIIFLLAYIAVFPAVFAVGQIYPGAHVLGGATQPETHRLIVTITTSFFLALFMTLGTWLFFRLVDKDNQNLEKPVLFGIGTTSVGAFLSGFVLAYTLIVVWVTGWKEPSQSIRIQQPGSNIVIERQSHLRELVVEGAVWKPFLPLIRVMVYLPWFIFFALLIYLGITRGKPVWVIASFLIQFGVGLIPALLTPSAPEKASISPGIEIARIAFGLPAIFAIRGFFKGTSQQIAQSDIRTHSTNTGNGTNL